MCFAPQQRALFQHLNYFAEQICICCFTLGFSESHAVGWQGRVLDDGIDTTYSLNTLKMTQQKQLTHTRTPNQPIAWFFLFWGCDIFNRSFPVWLLELCHFLLHGPAGIRFRRHASPERWRRFWSAVSSGSSGGTERMLFCRQTVDMCWEGLPSFGRDPDVGWSLHGNMAQWPRSSKLCLRFFALTGRQKPHSHGMPFVEGTCQAISSGRLCGPQLEAAVYLRIYGPMGIDWGYLTLVIPSLD